MCRDSISASAAVASSVLLFIVALIVAAGAWAVGKIPEELKPRKEPEVQSETAAVYLVESNQGPPSMDAGVVQLPADPYAVDADNHGNEDDQAALIGQ